MNDIIGNNVLTINGLTKRYGSLVAVNNLSFEVNRGEVYGILGPNGSGKTTTLGMVMGIIRPNNGSFSWFDEGKNNADVRKRIGVLLETPNFYAYLNAVDNLKIVANIKEVRNPQINDLLSLVNLAGRKHSAFRTYSLGMKQRLGIAAALVGDPDVLIFDEPTNGLDPEGIAEVRDIIVKIANRGKTIIMASHILDEVEKICSHVAIIKFGNLLSAGSVADIMRQEKTVEVRATNMFVLEGTLESCPIISSWKEQRSGFLLTLNDGYSAADFNRFAFEQGVSLSHLLVKKRSLEEKFLEITKN